jgi:hypothetical protein
VEVLDRLQRQPQRRPHPVRCRLWLPGPGARRVPVRVDLLLALGLLALLGYVFLARMYFFSTPLRGVILASALYAFGLIAGRS